MPGNTLVELSPVVAPVVLRMGRMNAVRKSTRSYDSDPS